MLEWQTLDWRRQACSDCEVNALQFLFEIYRAFLIISGIAMLVVAAVRAGQTRARRVWNAVFGAAFILYGLYLLLVFHGGGHYFIFFYAFILPILVIVQVVRDRAVAQAKPQAAAKTKAQSPAKTKPQPAAKTKPQPAAKTKPQPAAKPKRQPAGRSDLPGYEQPAYSEPAYSGRAVYGEPTEYAEPAGAGWRPGLRELPDYGNPFGHADPRSYRQSRGRERSGRRR
ncbi:MAG: hypothetical protein J2P27_07785 [Actinobacteria bacterium]|nr:hypothetical protein [Actinomycetota bacterium]